MSEYTPTNNGVFGAQQAPLLPEIESALASPYQGMRPQGPPQTFTESLNEVHARPTPPYIPDDGAVGKQKKANDFWADLEKKRHWELVREGMRRHPENLEQAYQWAHDRIQEIQNPKPLEDRYFVPKPYEGTI